MAQEPTQFFDFAAYVGLTKQLGGIEATEELAKLCHIGPGSHVLDVGCGAGVTPCFLAKSYDCRVVGVDIRGAMVTRSREQAQREGVADRVEFRVADVQDLPFEDELFDAVTSESVTAFPEDKQRAVNEYARVTKPGGYIGLNESTWRKTPPPLDVVAWSQQDLGGNVAPLAAAEWVALLEAAGLTEIVQRTYDVNPQREARKILQRYGVTGMLRVYWRTLGLYRRNPAYRAFVKHIRQVGLVPENITEYFGYGLYVGRKPA
jgi:arsenite methyltransferase